MYNDLRKSKNKGFSLVELIVVIAIMAVMTAVLAPALLQYVEKSRAQKDDSAMGEVVEVVKLAMAEQDVYDECLCYAVEGNKSHYAVGADETAWSPDGTMRGLTITFHADKSANATKFELSKGNVNEFVAEGVTSFNGTNPKSTLGAMTSGNGNNELYTRVKAGIEDGIVDLTSQTYRNSNYTIFIIMGNSNTAVNIYGQWNGTNLPGSGSSNSNGEEDPVCTKNDSCEVTVYEDHLDGCPKKQGSGSVEPKDSLNDYSWSELKTLAALHLTADEYKNTYHLELGAKKENKYVLVDYDNYGGFVFMYNSGFTHAMNAPSEGFDSGDNNGGYANSEMHTYLNDINGEVYQALPDELKSAIKTVNTISCNDGYYENDNKDTANGTNQTISATLFLPSVREVSGTQSLVSNGTDYTPYLDAEGSTFDYFTNPATELGNRQNINNSSHWWLRSALGGSNSGFWYVRRSGVVNGNAASSSNAVVPAFVIG